MAPEKAEAGFDDGGCRIGSVLARDGGVVSQGRNHPVQGGNPTVLEELDALRKAGRQKTYRAITQFNFVRFPSLSSESRVSSSTHGVSCARQDFCTIKGDGPVVVNNPDCNALKRRSIE
ncbi:nucleoside deaminase [Ruegeria sp. HKCCD6157]|uniref:nucleoside deaminase n=1 Tax=Ruegeria sp. HKCCD6157 TaxID=2690707 RepID=UPI00209D1910|nr:nucleoside deaminase [Ruegeria sp. HKCCD6157]